MNVITKIRDLRQICDCKCSIYSLYKQSIAFKNSRQLSTYNKVSDVNVDWRSVVGLEIHAQISSESKLFSGAGTEFGNPINQSVSFFDCAIPGTLPVLNRNCVEAAILTALALECKINPVSMFDRKHYFYADLPTGYQITQQRAPLANNGILKFEVFSPGKAPYSCISHLKQIQIEQDSGKSLHDQFESRSLVDLNRAGVPLMELVFEPDLSHGEEAAALVKELSLILQKLGTCSGKMEEGALRVDANVSIQKGKVMGQRTEIKNIGSVRGVANAIQSEITRQLRVLKSGGTVVSETRSYDANTKSTLPMRDKEEFQDYRFMPEPNLPPIRLSLDGSDDHLPSVPKIKKKIPELPVQTRHRLKELGLSIEACFSLVDEPLLLNLFHEVIKQGNGNRNPRLVANLILQDLLQTLHKNKSAIEYCGMSAEQFGDLVDLLSNGSVNLLIARKVLQELVATSVSALPTQLVHERGWLLISDKDSIEKICQETIDLHPAMVKEFTSGNKKVFGALIGIIAKKTNQQADMNLVTKCMKQLLSKIK